jgi:glycerol uptake facilitator protein
MSQPSLRSALIGEFLGTALLILLGDGVVASVALLDKETDGVAGLAASPHRHTF